jgi:hydroxymethylbilane synthase
MSEKFVIGSRGSDLALWQANYVKNTLDNLFPEKEFEIKIIHTTGDQVLDTALSKIGDKGLFTKQIEAELIDGGIDMAVHSLKDLQTAQPGGLVVGAICERELPNDIFISRSAASIDDLPLGARVATGSLRRRSQLLHYRPDLIIEEIRGNVPTRLRKFDESDLDGMVLAYAGVYRLGLGERITQLVPLDIILPAVGQGAVAIEIRSDDERARDVVQKLDHQQTRVCVTAERAFLRRLEGGCQVPIGAHATLERDTVTLEGMVGSLDGTVIFRERVSGSASDADPLGTQLADSLIKKGARDVLDNTREQVVSSSKGTI